MMRIAHPHSVLSMSIYEFFTLHLNLFQSFYLELVPFEFPKMIWTLFFAQAGMKLNNVAQVDYKFMIPLFIG